MKIKFLGTGNIASTLNGIAYLINNNILVDISNGTCKRLKQQGHSLNEIDTIYITHFHGDHYFDLPFFLVEKAKCQNNKLTIIGPNGLEEKVSTITEMAFPNSYGNIIKECHITFVESDSDTINSTLMEHGNIKPCYGYTFNLGCNIVSFTGDSCLCDGVIKLAQKSDYLIMDTSFFIGDNKHMGINDLEYLLSLNSNLKIIPVHMSNEVKEKLLDTKLDRVIIKNDFEELELV